MEARQTPLLIGAGAAVVAIISAAVILRGAPRAIAGESEAGVVATLGASASAASSASAPAASREADAAPRAASPAREGGVLDTAVSAAADAAADAGPSRPHVVRIDESDEGKVIELGPGQQLLATLNANPTTGFDWAVIKAPSALGAPEMGYVSSGDAPGAPGKRHLTWTIKAALPAAEQLVELGYSRSFEKGVAPFKTFRFKVRSPR